MGSWLNYVAVLTLVERFSQGALAISGVVLIRFLPSLFWAPICGVVADRCALLGALIKGSPVGLASDRTGRAW